MVDLKKQQEAGITLFWCIVIAALLVVFCPKVHAQEYTDDQIVRAIGKAENSKAHPYGIMKKYKHTTAKQACRNTVRHARRDWNGQGDFIVFLQKRYAPIGVSNDPKGLNKNWTKNVQYFLKRG